MRRESPANSAGTQGCARTRTDVPSERAGDGGDWVAYRGLTELHIVASMHERKALMAELADGFVALPGGFGTLDEFCEILTSAQLGLHPKPCGLLNVAGYFDPLLQ